MSPIVTLDSDQEPILACTVARDVQRFKLLIDDMDQALGKAWGDLGLQESLAFLSRPDSNGLQFIAIAIDGEDEAELSQIAEVIRTAKTKKIKVLLIANQISPTVLYQMQKLGADDFVPYPLPQGALHEAIERLCRPAPLILGGMEPHPTAPRPKSDRNGVILPVHGMAGGVGSTTFAANLAWELCLLPGAENRKVCILDLDLQFGSVATYLDLPRKEAVIEVLSDTAGLDADSFIASMAGFKDRLQVLTAPSDMVPLDMITPEDVTRILDMAQANFDYVFIDMPHTVVTWTETVLTRAHVYFALLDLDLRSAQNILRFVRALKAEALPHEKLRYVLNRAPRFTDFSAKARVRRMAESLDIRIEMHLPDGGEQVTQANDRGMPIVENTPKNPLRKELQKLAKSLFDVTRAAEVKRA